MPAPLRHPRQLVVGVGHPDRGDDAVGPVVVERVLELMGGGPEPRDAVTVGLDVVVHADPTRLPELWEGAGLAVVVDALRCDRPVGSVVVRSLAEPAAALGQDHGWARGGTHALGVLEAVELSRVLGTLPPEVIAVGVVAGDVEPGAGLSPEVAAVIDTAAQVVVAVLARAERRQARRPAPARSR